MRILVVPDSFKGSLTAPLAAAAIARGVREAECDATVDLCPVSDGGEGFLDVLVDAHGGARHTSTVMGPLGDEVCATWGVLPDGTAVLESAQVIGLARVPEPRRDPGQTTSYGLGQLLGAALDAGARRIVVGLGGSTTNDGGAGLAAALGVRFGRGDALPVGDSLESLSHVDCSGVDQRLSKVEIVIASDVTSPLTGPEGAALMFATQKGASPGQAHALERGLARLADLLGDAGTHPGDGSAGGLGFGLRVLCGARMVSGADLVLDSVRFDARLAGAELVMTGEGRVDAQTVHGKVLGRVCRRAGAREVPVVALVGGMGRGFEALYDAGLTACFAIADGPLCEADARRRGAELLAASARDVVRLLRARR